MAFLLRTFRLLLPVHDISTVYGDEIPLFLKGKQSKPQLVGLCKAAYSEVQPMHIQGANAAHVVDLVTQAASCMPNWSLTVDARDQGMLQYLAVTKRLKFKDDVVIRVRQLPHDMVVVDLRSRSRVGQGDMGANAGRILAFQGHLQQLLAKQHLVRL